VLSESGPPQLTRKQVTNKKASKVVPAIPLVVAVLELTNLSPEIKKDII